MSQEQRTGFVLRERISGKYFVRMVAIGPMLGSHDEAATFSTEDSARSCPAFSFALTVFEVVPA